MPINCKFGDVDKLRGQPGREGMLQRLWNHQAPSLVDAYRIQRFVKAALEAVKEYEQVLLTLGKELGAPKDDGTLQILPEHRERFATEKKKLDETPCEVASLKLPAQSCEGFVRTAADLDALAPFVDLPSIEESPTKE